MANAARTFKSNTPLRQAAILAAARRRRRSLCALIELHQTRFVPIGGPFPSAVVVVKNANSPVTFRTRVICDAVPSGPLITVGGQGTGLSFVSGGKLRASYNGASIDSQFSFQPGARLDVALAIVPGTGRFRAYIESTEVIDGVTTPSPYVTSGNLVLGDAGVVNDDGLRLYALHVPREMIGGGTPAGTAFDDILFRAAAHLMGADQLTPIHISTTP